MSFNSFLAAERISATLRLLRVLGKIGKIIKRKTRGIWESKNQNGVAAPGKKSTLREGWNVWRPLKRKRKNKKNNSEMIDIYIRLVFTIPRERDTCVIISVHVWMMMKFTFNLSDFFTFGYPKNVVVVAVVCVFFFFFPDFNCRALVEKKWTNERTNETTKVKKNASSAKPTERENPFASCLRTCCAPFWWWWGNAIHGPFYTTEGDVTFSPPSLKRKNFVWFFGRNRECFIL